jgi:predicted DNA-binding protein (MmcQ/YjbR family)
MAARNAAKQAEAVLRRFALSYPEAREDFPWGERVVKVRNKVFVFLGCPDDGLHMSVKLPRSGVLALTLPFTSPTGYGLARGGWVTARFGARDKPPVDVLRAWIDESYRAVAPKRLAAALPAVAPTARASQGRARPTAISDARSRPKRPRSAR